MPPSAAKSTDQPTTFPRYPLPDPVAFSANMARLAGRLPTAMALMAQGQNADSPADPLDIRGTLLRAFLRYAADPRRVMESQAALLQSHLSLWAASGRRLAGYPSDESADSGDRRFRHAEWSENLFFDFLKQSYLLTQNWLEELITESNENDDHEQKKAAFYIRQVFNALSPANFAPTNPEVVSETLNSSGANLVRGMDNFIADLKRGDGRLAISQTDMNAFSIGENIATTPGKVVFRNAMMELIQYAPTTKQVFKKPLLIVPPWINKFYILDLNAEKSFIRWAVGKGHTVFVISWVNPDAETAAAAFSDYMNDGLLAALEAVEQATAEKSVNAVGYCIGGTLLGATLARMCADKGKDGSGRIASATFFAAQMDFSQAGDLSIFIDEKQLNALEEMMQARGGYLAGETMAQTFNMLRSNDLIWGYVINNYLMGKKPPSFDLLYWNADSTRMPAKMHLFYLRECYLRNNLARGRMVLDGVRLDLGAVKIPVYFQSGREDHIAPCQSVYKATKLFGGPVRFIVAGSGHIAGVINPPAAKRYKFWTGDKTPDSLDEWFADATETPGSWWPDWQKWIARRGGGKVAARIPGDGKLAAIEDAPGSYVLVRG